MNNLALKPQAASKVPPAKEFQPVVLDWRIKKTSEARRIPSFERATALPLDTKWTLQATMNSETFREFVRAMEALGVSSPFSSHHHNSGVGVFKWVERAGASDLVTFCFEAFSLPEITQHGIFKALRDG
jgi:hypothetical protein